MIPLGATKGRQDGWTRRSRRCCRAKTDPQGAEQALFGGQQGKASGSGPYQTVVTDFPGTQAFDIVVREGQLWLSLNSRHPLYRDLYGPLAMRELPRDQDVAKQLALTVLAAVRAELGTPTWAGRVTGRRFRQTLADVLATFMNG